MEPESQLVEFIARALSIGVTSNSRAQRAPRHLSASGNRSRSALSLAIGDDAAIIAPAPHNDWVLTCDAFLEGVHFRSNLHPPDSVGYKSLARAASDLAAMGATPRFFLLTLALPPQIARAATDRHAPALQFAKNSTVSIGRRALNRSVVGRGFSHDIDSAPKQGASAPEVPSHSWLNEFLKGMARAARELGITIIGGDTTKSDSVFISITALGEIPRGRALTRSGAKPGDLLFVSGKLGRAQLGLELVLRGLARDRGFRVLTHPHLYPKIRVALGEWLARSRVASSAMDISDGLSTDLARLCQASRVGATIWANKVPAVKIPPAAAKKLAPHKLDPQQLALHGGDDYELLFTASPRQAKKLRNAPGASALTAIGEITKSPKILLIQKDGSAAPLKSRGWDPFRNP